MLVCCRFHERCQISEKDRIDCFFHLNSLSDTLDLEKNDKYEINDLHIDNFGSSINVDLESNIVNSTQDNEIVVHAQELGFFDTQFHEQRNKDCNSTLILSNDPETLLIEDTVEE